MGDGILALHRRLIDGDPLASEEASRLLLAPLVEETQRQFPRLDDQVIADAVVDALLDYFEHPSRADEGGGGPRAFLKRAAWRNAANLDRGSKRRKRREDNWMGDPSTAGVEHRSGLGMLIQAEDQAELDRRIAELEALLPEAGDRAVLRLRLAGERGVAAFASVLGVAHLSPTEQRKVVKQVKDRIDKVLKRRGGGRV